MNFDSRINSERVVIASTLLVGWAIWTAWRHLILPALIAGGGLLLVATGWQPEPAPALVGALPPANVNVVPVMTTDPVQIPQRLPLLDTPSFPDLPPAVQQQIRARVDRLSRDA